MYVNPVLYSYSAQKYGQITQDYRSVTSKFDEKDDDKDKSIFVLNTKRQTKELSDYISGSRIRSEYVNQSSDIVEAVPLAGKIDNAIDKIKDNDIIPASGIISLALLNGPEDIREIKSAYEQIKALVQNKPYNKPYDYKVAQHPFSFFRGTLISEYLNPFSVKCKFPKLANKLLALDKSLWDTKLGDWIAKIFNMQIKKVNTQIEDIISSPTNKKTIKANQYISPSKFGNLTARAMTRTPVLGVVFNSAMEAAHVIKESEEGNDTIKEVGKAAARLTATTAITGYLGAIGSRRGPAGSIAAIGLGAVLNAKIERMID